MTLRRVTALIALAVTACAILAAACGSDHPPVPPVDTPLPTPTATPAPIPTPEPSPTPPESDFPPISLPADDGPHDATTEWWYFSGHLSGGGPESQVAFHYVIFKVAVPETGGYALMGHLSLTDLSSGEHAFDERITLNGPGEAEGLSIGIADWTISGTDGDFAISSGTADVGFSLSLTAEKPAVIHPGPDGDGLVYYSDQDVSYYYSYTRLAAGGTLTIDGRELPASGTVWMDHQWGDFAIDPSGWDWFALHLSDGTDLMIATVRGDDAVSGLGTHVDRDGRPTAVTAQVTALERWTSEATGAAYPVSWTVLVPELDMSLSISAVTPAAEIDPSVPNVPTYWEGPITASGSRSGINVTGTGFAELVGYAPDG